MHSSLEGLVAISNLLLAGSVVAGSIAAWVGLTTWKKQSLWHGNSELAKRAILALYTYRNALYSVRHPAISNIEMVLSDEELQNNSVVTGGAAKVKSAYIKRWKKHEAAKAELETIFLEVNAVWGEKMSKLFEPIANLESELRVTIHMYLNTFYGGDEVMAKEYRKIFKSRRNIIFDRFDAEDIFRQDFDNYLKPIENYLRDKMGVKA